MLQPIHLLHHLSVFLLVAFAIPGLACELCVDEPGGPPDDLQLFLLIGQSNMAGRAKIPDDAAGVIDRCFLLNEKNEWEPARNPLNRYSTTGKGAGMQKLGPGYGFVLKMLEEDPNLKIGLIVNARGGSKIESWVGEKPDLYWAARKRMKVAMKSGTLKGVLWHQGESNSERPDGYLDKLKTLVGNVRNDFGDTDLPFVAGQINNVPAINDQIAKLPEVCHATAFASSEGLKATDRWHFDTKSQLLLGERYAEQMLKLLAEQPAAAKPPEDVKFIDTHVHAMAVNEGGLDAVAKWMDERNVERCVVSPLNHKGSRAWTEEERSAMLANYAKYKGRIDRMCIIDPGEVGTVDEAVAILKREISDGAIAFGEHYGRDLMFDDPKNLLLYEACEKVGLPVMFHIDQNKNMVEPGMKRVDRVLEMFPDCKVIAHAYWWRQLGNGSCDRQLQEHPNLYADMSGHVVVNVLNRDRKYAREFLIRNQDKILWATDEGWWSFGSRDKQMNQHYTFFEELDLPEAVRYKIYRGNAEKLFGWEKE
ncbi:amidohydrolase [Haloferula helveola]|uniref:Amidohydrolase n=1 Tax=Haloferula helveola TaxID=490095 RepID=A0ABN6H4G7_9BACT|nr:amidohydrolase [Haloferula helveola]